MTSQTLDVQEEISKIQTSQNPIYDTKSEKVYRAASSCSCPKCDSIDCFKKIYEKGNVLCTCPDCKNMIFSKNDTSKKSDEECNCKVNKKVEKEDGRRDPLNTDTKCDLPNKKSDDKIYSELTIKAVKKYAQKDVMNAKTKHNNMKSEKSDDKMHLELPRKVNKEDEQENALSRTNTKHDFVHKKSKGESCHDKIMSSKKHTLKEHIKTEKSEVDLCVHTEFINKEEDMPFIKDEMKKRDSFEESYLTQNCSVAMTYTRKEEMGSDDPTATLSAQVMDLPYQAYKDSLSSHRPINSVNANKITKPDILAKLKEIYKACSCKICECIPSYSATYDVVKVNSCGFEDTKHNYIHNTQRDSHNSQHDCIQLPHSGCACYRCDRKDCQGVCKNKMETATCDCAPCQCAECTALNFHIACPVLLAPVQGNFQQSLCQCEQCECVHCAHNYDAIASSEVSTGMTSHRNCNCDTCANNSCQFDSVDCSCDTQNKIVRKPIDRCMRDYDLHQTSVEENHFSQKRSVKIKNCDTIAMFAFSNNYSNSGFNKSRDSCHCMGCDCIICRDKEKYGSRVKNSYEGIALAFSNLSGKSFTTCKCQSCECQLCKNVEAESDMMLATRAVNNCRCDTCGCMSCKGLPYCFQNKEINDNSKHIFKNKLVNNSVETFEDFSNNISTDYFYPLKKGKLLTPSMFEAKILSNRQFLSQSSLPNVPLPSKSILKVNSTKSNKKLLCPQSIKICNLKSVNNHFDIVCKQPSNKKLLYEYLDISKIHTVPKHCDDTIEHNTIRCNTNAKKCINNIEAPSTSFIFPKKLSAICVDNTINEMNNYNQRNMEENNNEVKLLNSIQISNVLRTSKGKRNGDLDLFCSRILSFEKSILQIQEDLSQSRKVLDEICSKNGMLHDDFSVDNAATSFYDVITGKSLSSIHETNLIDPPEYIENYKKPGIVTNSDNDKIGEIINNTKTLLDSIDNNNFNYLKNEKKDNFSKGDNKTYTTLIKKSRVNFYKLKRNFARSRVKKLSRNSENKIIDFINTHVKQNYRHHGKNILNRKYSTKSASTSHENFLMAVEQKLKFKEGTEYSQTDIYSYQGDGMPWSVLQNNLHTNHTPVTHRGICTIPELKLNTERAVQSISTQTNETQGCRALNNLQTEVSKLLNAPLLQLKTYCLKSDLNEENTDFKVKSKLDLVLKHNIICDTSSQTHKHTFLADKETNCNIGQSVEELSIDMTKLVDLLLARTVFKSELTKPFSRIPKKSEVPKNNSVKSASEGLKARFLGLRRVSDHTVLVRWKMPLQMEDVQGYELQVDGRPVQKILSPTRCMAVLTCLPHCEKLVLTIRTLTFSNLPSDHHPAATIVYWPRDKRSRYHRLNFAEELQ